MRKKYNWCPIDVIIQRGDSTICIFIWNVSSESCSIAKNWPLNYIIFHHHFYWHMRSQTWLMSHTHTHRYRQPLKKQFHHSQTIHSKRNEFRLTGERFAFTRVKVACNHEIKFIINFATITYFNVEILWTDLRPSHCLLVPLLVTYRM